MSDAPAPPSAGACLRALTPPDGTVARALDAVYGAGAWDDRVRLWRDVIKRYLDTFGDEPVRLVRCPSRINLRGMHVDTHGGYLT